MILCDIGNTSYHFLDDNSAYKKDVEMFDPQTIEEKVYFISVNCLVNKKLKLLNNWINLEELIDKNEYYSTMGIDRIFAIQTVVNAVVVDAGSAITVDVVKEGVFMGGFIYPGILAMQKTYANISQALAYEFNFDLDLARLPKNSRDAISYGYLKSFYSEVNSFNLDILLTGGNASEMKKIFKEATVDESLVFKGMKHFIEKNF